MAEPTIGDTANKSPNIGLPAIPNWMNLPALIAAHGQQGGEASADASKSAAPASSSSSSTPASTNTPATPATAAPPDLAQQEPLVDPLAMQLFATSILGPMMQGLQQNLGQQNAQFAGMAQHNLDTAQMPEQFRAIFGQMIPQMASNQNDVVASLMGAQAAAPALDQLMSNINAAKSAQTQAYHEFLAKTTLDQLLPSSGGTLPPGTTPTGAPTG